MALLRFAGARLLGLVLLAFPTALVSVVACSSDKDSGSADSGASASQPCASLATFLECDICCGMPSFYSVLQKAADDCVCDDACKTECASACSLTNPTAPTKECETCSDSAQTASKCQPKVDAECNKDPECVKAQACSRAAACDDKPDDVDGG